MTFPLAALCRDIGKLGPRSWLLGRIGIGAEAGSEGIFCFWVLACAACPREGMPTHRAHARPEGSRVWPIAAHATTAAAGPATTESGVGSARGL